MSVEAKINLKKGERIINIIRRYGLTFFWHFVLVFALFAVAFFFMFWLFAHSWWGITLFVLPIIIGIVVLIRALFLWRKNIFILTTHRLVDIDQRGFFDQVVSDIPYDQLEDVHGRIKGIWQTIFHYGNVNIQIGNGKVLIIIDNIKNPLRVQQEINQLRENYLIDFTHKFNGNLADAVIDKIFELEVDDLEKIRIVVEKRLIKLGIKK